MPRQPPLVFGRVAVLTTRPEFGDSGRARRVESKQSKILDVLRQSKGPTFEQQDAMAVRFVLVKEVLSEYRAERASPDDDDVKRTSIILRAAIRAACGLVCAAKRFIQGVADVTPEYVTTESCGLSFKTRSHSRLPSFSFFCYAFCESRWN